MGYIIVEDASGAVGQIEETALAQAIDPLVVLLANGSRVSLPARDITTTDTDRYTTTRRFAELPSAPSLLDDGQEQVVIPIVEERGQISKRETETARVRVRKSVQVHDEQVKAQLMREAVEIEHVDADGIFDEPPQPYQEGNEWVLPVVEEIVVVQKKYRVREQVRVRVNRWHEPYEETVTLRKESVDVERVETPSNND